MTPQPVIHVDDIRKTYGRTVAVDAVSFDVQPGEIFGLSGLFVPVASLPPLLQTVARALPFTYVVSLLRGIWRGESWSGHAGDVAVLTLMFLVMMAVTARVFRWE